MAIADLNSSKNIWTVIALTLMTSLTSLGNTLLSSDNGVAKEIEVIKKDLMKITESINVINKRSNLSYLGMDKAAIVRSAYNFNFISMRNGMKDVCKQSVPFKIDIDALSNFVDVDDFNIFISESICDVTEHNELSKTLDLSLINLDPIVIESKEKD